MSVVYIRLPHYVASYLRNQDLQNPIPAGQPIVIETSDPLYRWFSTLPVPNFRNAVNIDCFSEKQWQAMMRGKYISYRDGFQMDMARKADQSLSLGEIFILSGNEARVKRDAQTAELLPDHCYNDEYVPFALPRIIVRDGREYKAYSDYYISDVSHIRNELINRYRTGAIAYIAEKLVEACQDHIDMSKMEALDKCLIRFDIRLDERERERGKKMLQRMDDALRYLVITKLDNKHKPFAMRMLEKREVARKSSKSYPIICTDTGTVYPSIAEFSRAIGANPHVASNDLRRGYTCNGFHFRYATDDEAKSLDICV